MHGLTAQTTGKGIEPKLWNCDPSTTRLVVQTPRWVTPASALSDVLHARYATRRPNVTSTSSYVMTIVSRAFRTLRHAAGFNLAKNYRSLGVPNMQTRTMLAHKHSSLSPALPPWLSWRRCTLNSQLDPPSSLTRHPSTQEEASPRNPQGRDASLTLALSKGKSSRSGNSCVPLGTMPAK